MPPASQPQARRRKTQRTPATDEERRMQSTATTMDAPLHWAGHDEQRSFVRRYVFSTDHKVIGIQFLFMSLFFLLVCGLLAAMMRWQIGYPGQPMPGSGIMPETTFVEGIMLPEFYNSAVTMHGTIMVYFA